MRGAETDRESLCTKGLAKKRTGQENRKKHRGEKVAPLLSLLSMGMPAASRGSKGSRAWAERSLCRGRGRPLLFRRCIELRGEGESWEKNEVTAGCAAARRKTANRKIRKPGGDSKSRQLLANQSRYGWPIEAWFHMASADPVGDACLVLLRLFLIKSCVCNLLTWNGDNFRMREVRLPVAESWQEPYSHAG